MKLLISAYACAPNWGSEHAVGWNWITEAHRQGHQVWALASSAHRPAIQAACRDDPALRGIVWAFPEVAVWPLRSGVEPVWERSYNLLWQVAALRHARALCRRVRLDAIHHLTWGGVRAPTFLGRLGPPLILGPLGGGETSPRSLRDGFGPRAKLTEAVRDLSNATVAINPLLRIGLTQAAAIFVRTPDTRRLLTRSMRAKAIDFMEISVGAATTSRRPHPPGSPRLLFAGRLIYWKGVHIAIRAFADIAASCPGARLTIVGKGSELPRLQGDAARLGVAGQIDFVPWLPQQDLFQCYADHDLLIFPSLHDSGGNVVIEALSHGCPVVCLDLGGPREIVTPQSGIVIATAGRTTAQVASAIARATLDLLADPQRLAALSRGGVQRAGDFALHDRVAQFYRLAEGQGLCPRTPTGSGAPSGVQRQRPWPSAAAAA